ncbi:MAG: hypothetical protein ABIZ81_11065 [Opitutaceae bacterium]
MKTKLLLLALVASVSALAGTPNYTISLAATAPQDAPYGFVVRQVTSSPNTEIERGTTQMTVQRLLGTPQRQLSPEVWVYSGYHPVPSNDSHALSCDRLIITFSAGRVVDLKIVNPAAVQVFAARLGVNPTAQQIAKTKN